MSKTIPPAEIELISGVSSGWLWAARCFALICTITLGLGFVVGHTRPTDQSWYKLGFFPWGLLSLALLFLLLRRGKNSLAFALGLGAATSFIALLGVASGVFFQASRSSRGGLPMFFLVTMAALIRPPFWVFLDIHSHLATFGALLLWPFSISSAMLGLSTVVAFMKMARESKEIGKLRRAFRAGIRCAVVFWLIMTLPVFLFLWFLLASARC